MTNGAMMQLELVLPMMVFDQRVLYPGGSRLLHLADARWKQLIDDALETPGKTLAYGYFLPKPDPNTGGKLLCSTFLECKIIKKTEEDGEYQVRIYGIRRLRFNKYKTTDRSYWVGVMEPVAEKPAVGDAIFGEKIKMLGEMMRQEFAASDPPNKGDLAALKFAMESPGRLADFVVQHCGDDDSDYNSELCHLGDLDIASRVERAHKFLARYIARSKALDKVKPDINARVQSGLQNNQRRFVLREQKLAIAAELAELERAKKPAEPEEPMEDKINRLTEAAPEAYKTAMREWKRLKQMGPTHEADVSRNYLDWILGLPWGVMTKENEDIPAARRILDADHYGLAKVKKRILEYLAVRKIAKDKMGPILCYIGPPGVGKTSLALSLAKATGRKLVRISLGGVNDEAAIRGHRRTYVGALPGKIIQGMKKAGTSNPIFVLDEIDKLTATNRGDPASALLEVLDPEQNSAFSDHYLEIPFNLSKVMFICTANNIETIPPTLLDRLEVITLPGYTLQEKQRIAQGFLWRKQLAEHGLEPDSVRISDGLLALVAEDYTREAGVRNLEREIANIIRAIAVKKVRDEPYNAEITADNIREYLGPKRFEPELADEENSVGVVNGLGLSPTGGSVLKIEAVLMPGKGETKITGHIADESSMQESVKIAYSFAKSHAAMLGISREFDKLDLHVNFPSLAIPKDGPSAGLAICTALVSRLTNRPVRKDVAMTGEITLRGLALPIGGLKEKMLAAHRAGCKVVLFPERNRKDLVDIPDEIKNDLELVPVKHINDVLSRVLV